MIGSCLGYFLNKQKQRRTAGQVLAQSWTAEEAVKRHLSGIPPSSTVCVCPGQSVWSVICHVREEGAFQKGREKLKLLGNSKVLGRSHKKQQLHWEEWWRKDMRFSQITRILILSVLISQVCRVFMVLLFYFFPSVLKFYCLFWERLRLKLDMSLSEHVLKLAGQNILLI